MKDIYNDYISLETSYSK